MKMSVYEYKWFIISIIFLIGIRILIINDYPIGDHSMTIGVCIGIITMFLCSLDWVYN